MLASAGIALASDFLVLALAAALVTGLAFGPIWPSAMALAAEGRASSAPAETSRRPCTQGKMKPPEFPMVTIAAGATTGIAMSAVLCAGMLVVTSWARAREA
jgi:hypothetical protein